MKIQRLSARLCENTEIVRTIIDLAESLEMGIVAEGVETDTQLEGLRTLGCRHIQGFYFAKPMTPEETLRFIKQTHQ